MPEKEQAEGKEGSLLWWALGLLLTGMLILGLGTVMVWRMVSPQVEVIRTTAATEGKAPAKAGAEGEDTGLPRYPGAEISEPGTTVEIESPSEDSIAVTTAKFTSKDELEKVDLWYKERLGADFEREGAGKMDRKRVIYGIEVSASDVAFLQDREHLLQAVVLRRKDQVTEIVLLRAGEPREQ